jgi:hypothetical protein
LATSKPFTTAPDSTPASLISLQSNLNPN